jgi:hypothetical protein
MLHLPLHLKHALALLLVRSGAALPDSVVLESPFTSTTELVLHYLSLLPERLLEPIGTALRQCNAHPFDR